MYVAKFNENFQPFFKQTVFFDNYLQASSAGLFLAARPAFTSARRKQETRAGPGQPAKISKKFLIHEKWLFLRPFWKILGYSEKNIKFRVIFMKKLLQWHQKHKSLQLFLYFFLTEKKRPKASRRRPADLRPAPAQAPWRVCRYLTFQSVVSLI